MELEWVQGRIDGVLEERSRSLSEVKTPPTARVDFRFKVGLAFFLGEGL